MAFKNVLDTPAGRGPAPSDRRRARRTCRTRRVTGVDDGTAARIVRLRPALLSRAIPEAEVRRDCNREQDPDDDDDDQKLDEGEALLARQPLAKLGHSFLLLVDKERPVVKQNQLRYRPPRGYGHPRKGYLASPRSGTTRARSGSRGTRTRRRGRARTRRRRPSRRTGRDGSARRPLSPRRRPAWRRRPLAPSERVVTLATRTPSRVTCQPVDASSRRGAAVSMAFTIGRPRAPATPGRVISAAR